MALSVLHGQHRYELGPGKHFVGRAIQCDIVLEDHSVSRWHAVFIANDAAVFVDDVGSRNGIAINGSLVRARKRVKAGDTVLIGKCELHVEASLLVSQAEEPQSTRRTLSLEALETGTPRATETARPSSVPPSSGSGPRPDDPTRTFDLVGAVASRALEQGRIGDAQGILRTHLTQLIRSAQCGQTIGDGVLRSALVNAVDVATALRDPAWVDMALDLVQLGAELTPEVTKQLVNLIEWPGPERDHVPTFGERLTPDSERFAAGSSADRQPYRLFIVVYNELSRLRRKTQKTIQNVS